MVAALWMTVDARPMSILVGFAVIGAVTLPVYSILAAHANDQLSPGQVVPAAGTMAFLLQFGQVFGMLIGPNTLRLFDGRGLPLMLAVVGTVVVLIAVTRRVRSDAPEETGEVRPTGVIGIAQPGMLQAEVYAEDEAGPEPKSDESSHS